MREKARYYLRHTLPYLLGFFVMLGLGGIVAWYASYTTRAGPPPESEPEVVSSVAGPSITELKGTVNGDALVVSWTPSPSVAAVAYGVITPMRSPVPGGFRGVQQTAPGTTTGFNVRIVLGAAYEVTLWARRTDGATENPVWISVPATAVARPLISVPATARAGRRVAVRGRIDTGAGAYPAQGKVRVLVLAWQPKKKVWAVRSDQFVRLVAGKRAGSGSTYASRAIFSSPGWWRVKAIPAYDRASGVVAKAGLKQVLGPLVNVSDAQGRPTRVPRPPLAGPTPTPPLPTPDTTPSPAATTSATPPVSPPATASATPPATTSP